MAELKDVQRLKAELAKDLEIIQAFEELVARRLTTSTNGNGANRHEQVQDEPAIASQLPAAKPPVAKARTGANTGLLNIVMAAISHTPGMRHGEIIDHLIAQGYPHRDREGLSASVSSTLKRLLEKHKIFKRKGQYYPKKAIEKASNQG